MPSEPTTTDATELASKRGGRRSRSGRRATAIPTAEAQLEQAIDLEIGGFAIDLVGNR